MDTTHTSPVHTNGRVIEGQSIYVDKSDNGNSSTSTPSNHILFKQHLTPESCSTVEHAYPTLCGTPNSMYIVHSGVPRKLSLSIESSAHGNGYHATEDPMSEFASGEQLSQIQDRFFFPGRADVSEQVKNTWKLLITPSEIQVAVTWLACKLNRKFKNEPIILAGILKGVFIFMTDLCKLLTIPYNVYFLEASSYREGQHQEEKVEFLSKIVPSKFLGRKVVLLDELFDGGKTMHSIKQELLQHPDLHLKDIYTCTLFMKKKKREWPLPDLVALDNVPDLWVVGYGLDDAGEKRGWPLLFALPKHQPTCEEDKIFDDTEEGTEVYRRIRTQLRERLHELTAELELNTSPRGASGKLSFHPLPVKELQ